MLKCEGTTFHFEHGFSVVFTPDRGNGHAAKVSDRFGRSKKFEASKKTKPMLHIAVSIVTQFLQELLETNKLRYRDYLISPSVEVSGWCQFIHECYEPGTGDDRCGTGKSISDAFSQIDEMED